MFLRAGALPSWAQLLGWFPSAWWAAKEGSNGIGGRREDAARESQGPEGASSPSTPQRHPVTPCPGPTGSRTTEFWRGQLLLFAEGRNASTKDRLTPDQALTATTTWFCGTRSNDRV